MELEEPCLEWPLSKNNHGYGQCRVNGKMTKVHRWVWQEANGQIPEGMGVLHKCDNPPCYRLSHLYLGTPLDNARDRQARGRGYSSRLQGSRVGTSKLTEAQVAEIRRLLKDGLYSHGTIAMRYGVDRSLISRIGRGECWRHVKAT